MAPYEAGLNAAGKGELQDQRRPITHLCRIGPPSQRKVVIPLAVKELLAARNGPATQSLYRRIKIGRNERCLCQSGRKYKHCHGR
ncbi:SEC-C domain-containing protein [Alcaligenes faecalis]|nr:SEC-C domain-containing protein [Alcaligenes faecalis]